MSEKISECRFCGEKKDLKLMSVGVCFVECEVCRCRGPVEMFEVDAIDSWNNGITPEKKESKK